MDDERFQQHMAAKKMIMATTNVTNVGADDTKVAEDSLFDRTTK
jgi:hypothetical protein